MLQEQIPINKIDFKSHQQKSMHRKRIQEKGMPAEEDLELGADALINSIPKIPSIRINNDSSLGDMEYVIEVQGLPWAITKRAILDHFAKIDFLNGIKGIHFIIDEYKNNKNLAFIQLQLKEDITKACLYSNTKIDCNVNLHIAGK